MHRLAPTLLSLCLATTAAAAPPLDIDDPTPRSVFVEIDEDIIDFTSVGGLYGPPVLASFSSDGSVATVTLPGPVVEARFAQQFLGLVFPVAGSFTDYVFRIDVASREVVSADVAGSLSAVGLGTLDVTQTASSSETAGFMLQDFQGFDFPFYCTTGATCTLVPGIPYDPASGVARAVGRIGTGLLEFMTPFADIRITELVPPECEATFSADDVIPGEPANVTLAIRHSETSPVAAEMKVYLRSASGDVSLVNVGSDGSILLPEDLDLSFPDTTIFVADASTPLGTVTVGCRLLDPITGELLFESSDSLEVKAMR